MTTKSMWFYMVSLIRMTPTSRGHHITGDRMATLARDPSIMASEENGHLFNCKKCNHQFNLCWKETSKILIEEAARTSDAMLATSEVFLSAEGKPCYFINFYYNSCITGRITVPRGTASVC